MLPVSPEDRLLRGEREERVERNYTFKIYGAHLHNIDEARKLVFKADGQSDHSTGQTKFVFDLR